MTTAIIGIGQMGSALAHQMVGGGERVVLAEQETLGALCKKLGTQNLGSQSKTRIKKGK